MRDILLIDMNNLVFRTHFAVNPRYDPKLDGPPTGFISSSLGSLSRIRRMRPDTCFVMAYDGMKASWRKKLYSDYKGNRSQTDDVRSALYKELPKLRNILHGVLGFQELYFEGLEADDVIGLLSESFSSAHCRVLIFSNDADYTQLMNEHVSILRPSPEGDQLYGLRELQEETGFAPDRYFHVRCLAGDTGDKIPGIPGVGPKKASLYVKWGCHADLDWKEQPDKFKQAFPTLQPFWDTEERRISAVLTRIPRRVSDLNGSFNKQYKDFIRREIFRVCKSPWRQAPDRARWKEFLTANTQGAFGYELLRGL